jgi:hypothetical protein
MKTFFSCLTIIFIGCFIFPNLSEAADEIRTGVIYNMQGPKASAWDLFGISEKRLHENNLEKDLINTTKISDPLPFFRKELLAANGGSFVKANKFNFKDASLESVKKYFSKNKSVTVIKNIKAGDIYILKLKNAEGYAIIKISKIKDDKTSLLYDGDNLDYIAFDYKIFKVQTTEAIAFLEDDFEEEAQPFWDPEAEMLIYPNPVVDKIYVKFRKASDNLGWVVLIEDTNGEKVFKSETIYETHWENSIKDLPEGKYILSVLKSDKVYLQKIIDKNDAKKLSEVYQ